MRNLSKLFLVITVTFLFVVLLISSVLACEIEMARICGTIAREVTRGSGFEVEYANIDRLGQREAKYYDGVRSRNTLYVWAVIPYDESSQDMDMYVYLRNSDELLVKDDSNNPRAVIYTEDYLPRSVPVTTKVKMARGSGCFCYVVSSRYD